MHSDSLVADRSGVGFLVAYSGFLAVDFHVFDSGIPVVGSFAVDSDSLLGPLCYAPVMSVYSARVMIAI